MVSSKQYRMFLQESSLVASFHAQSCPQALNSASQHIPFLDLDHGSWLALPDTLDIDVMRGVTYSMYACLLKQTGTACIRVIYPSTNLRENMVYTVYSIRYSLGIPMRCGYGAAIAASP